MSTLKVANIHLDSSGFNRIDYLNDNHVRVHAIDRFSVSTANVEEFTVLSSGNVGISISSPTSLLHVNGTANIVSSLKTSAVIIGTLNVEPALSAAFDAANNAISANSNGYGIRYVSTGAPTGGTDGDIWYKVDS